MRRQAVLKWISICGLALIFVACADGGKTSPIGIAKRSTDKTGANNDEASILKVDGNGKISAKGKEKCRDFEKYFKNLQTSSKDKKKKSSPNSVFYISALEARFFEKETEFSGMKIIEDKNINEQLFKTSGVTIEYLSLDEALKADKFPFSDLKQNECTNLELRLGNSNSKEVMDISKNSANYLELDNEDRTIKMALNLNPTKSTLTISTFTIQNLRCEHQGESNTPIVIKEEHVLRWGTEENLNKMISTSTRFAETLAILTDKNSGELNDQIEARKDNSSQRKIELSPGTYRSMVDALNPISPEKITCL